MRNLSLSLKRLKLPSWKPPKITPWKIWVGILAVAMLVGVLAGWQVFQHGLIVTNLSDHVPWGLWITIDLSSIAMSAGAFSLCAVVYLLGLKHFQPVARTATFIGLIGYTMALLSLLLDIGRPDRFWHALVFWNHHSLLWEVTMCITLYLGVLLIECMPIFARSEWLGRRYPKLTQKMAAFHRFAPVLAVMGLCLSMLHQSSLGAIYGVLKSRPYWFRPDISVLFIISAIAGGISLTIFASMLSARLTPKGRVDDSLLEKLAHATGWILAIYLYFRFWDALAMTYTYEPGRTEGLNLLAKGPLSFNFWFGEILLGAVVPLILLLNKKTRQNPFWRMTALLLVVGGVVAYRWDTNLSGLLVVLAYLPGKPTVVYADYSPSLVELASGAGILAYGLLVFSIGVRYFSVVDHKIEEHEATSAPVVCSAPASAD